MDTWQTVDEERSALADDLASLDDSQWDIQSLCNEWKVRHVVGHLIGEDSSSRKLTMADHWARVKVLMGGLDDILVTQRVGELLDTKHGC